MIEPTDETFEQRALRRRNGYSLEDFALFLHTRFEGPRSADGYISTRTAKKVVGDGPG